MVYVDLPRVIYPPVKHMVYHPKMAELLFPSQPILRSLASEHSLITVVEKTELTRMQKNVIREWLARPVERNHPVYGVAEQLKASSVPSDLEYWSETELYSHDDETVREVSRSKYLSACDDHSEENKRQHKKKKRPKKQGDKKEPSPAQATDDGVPDLIDFGDSQDDIINIELDCRNDDKQVPQSSGIGDIAL